MNLLLDIVSIRNMYNGKAKQNHKVDNAEHNSDVKVIQRYRMYICNSRKKTCNI